MASKSAIEWTEYSWNPVTGCTKISPGCQNCYAERMAIRLQAMGHRNYVNGFKIALHAHILNAPLKWKRPSVVFVNSMSDLFHEDVPEQFIHKVFRVMSRTTQHQYQILTKRAERLSELNPVIVWPENVWMGVSVENQDYKYRIDYLRMTNARVKFVSFEPLLESMPPLDLKKIDWVIAGGESGPRARPVKPEWIIDIRNQCVDAGIPFFFKQWGGTNKKKNGRKLEGVTWNQLPAVATSLGI